MQRNLTIKSTKKVWVLMLFFVHVHVYVSYGQQAHSIQSGVTFLWDGPQPTQTSPAVLKGIVLNGVNYPTIFAPTGYQLDQVGPAGHGANNIWENGTNVANNSSSPGWNSAALAAYQSANLNYYFESYTNGANICNDFSAIPTTNAQRTSLMYSPGMISTPGAIVAVTERNANNCYHIAVYGIPPGGGPEQLLGQTFVRPRATASGACYRTTVTQ
jgi:hypothetical protein